MPRKRVVVKRESLPDPVYKSKLVAKFINALMIQGKKSLAQSILYKSFGIIEGKSKEDPLALFQKALNNVKPAVEVKSRRVGGSTYQVPTEVRPSRSQALSMRWIISFARRRWRVDQSFWCLKRKRMATLKMGDPLQRGGRSGSSCSCHGMEMAADESSLLLSLIHYFFAYSFFPSCAFCS